MYETLLLIAQAVKSGIPLSAAIRLTVSEQPQRSQAALLRLASLLDQGIEPKVAAAQSGLPSSVADLLDAALSCDDFASTFDELAKLEINRSLTMYRVLQALAYPLLLLVCTLLIFFQLLVFTVPQFEIVFKDFGMGIPPMTAGIIQLSHLARSPMFLLKFVALIVILSILVQFLFPRFWLCVPVLGNIGRSLYMTRMLRQLACQILRHVPLPEALEQCGKTMRHSAYRKDCRSAAEASRRGMPFWEITLRYYWLFPTWLAPMLAAEQTQSSLAKSLRSAAETVEQQKDTSVLFLQSLCLPMFILIVFTLICLFTFATMMPLISLIMSLTTN